jgi:hypothetical protein
MQRDSFMEEATSELGSVWRATATTAENKFLALLTSNTPQDWRAVGRFLARTRQVRRKMKQLMLNRCEKRAKNSYTKALREWRKEGNYVCAHGVFFDAPTPIDCPCLQKRASADWSHAVMMPALDYDLKSIGTDSFQEHAFQRIGVLRAAIRKLNW